MVGPAGACGTSCKKLNQELINVGGVIMVGGVPFFPPRNKGRPYDNSLMGITSSLVKNKGGKPVYFVRGVSNVVHKGFIEPILKIKELRS